VTWHTVVTIFVLWVGGVYRIDSCSPSGMFLPYTSMATMDVWRERRLGVARATIQPILCGATNCLRAENDRVIDLELGIFFSA
jgi:hypothetical protein